MDAYGREVSLVPGPSRDEAVTLTQRVHDGSVVAKASLVAACRRLVVTTASQYVRTIHHQDYRTARVTTQSTDAEQLAILLRQAEEVLLTAIDRIDVAKGFTYAAW